MRATVRVEWDMGHRLPNHDGKCRGLHGHRYAAEVTVEGETVTSAGASDEGMVVDFGPVKSAIRDVIDTGYDHKTFIHNRDPFAELLAQVPGVVLVTYVPTAENLTRVLLRDLAWTVHKIAALGDGLNRGVRISGLRIFETPTSWTDADRGDL